VEKFTEKGTLAQIAGKGEINWELSENEIWTVEKFTGKGNLTQIAGKMKLDSEKIAGKGKKLGIVVK
jgi:hypothetical protein